MSEDPQPQHVANVAIIGMAVRFPGAASLEQFWENLRDGVESISFFTDEELLAGGVDPALLADPAYVRARAVLDGVEDFDAAFFGFTPREAEVMDPQHRVLLECAWEALEDAAQDPERTSNRGDRNGLDQKLRQNVFAACAHRFADAYFLRPFSNRHQHDVHHDDSADDQRNCRDANRHDVNV